MHYTAYLVACPLVVVLSSINNALYGIFSGLFTCSCCFILRHLSCGPPLSPFDLLNGLPHWTVASYEHSFRHRFCRNRGNSQFTGFLYPNNMDKDQSRDDDEKDGEAEDEQDDVTGSNHHLSVIGH